MSNFLQRGLIVLFVLFSGVGYAQDCGPWDSGSLFPHATDCTKYYVCDFGVLIQRDCPPGLHFNDDTKFCDWPEDAGCTACGNICMVHYNITVNQIYGQANTDAFWCLYNVGIDISTSYLNTTDPLGNIISIYGIASSYPGHMDCVQGVFNNMDMDLEGSFYNLSDCFSQCA